MSNTITIELCTEDRARLDKLTTALEQRIVPAETFLRNSDATAEVAEAPTEPQEAPKEEPKTETPPAEETPQEATQEPESDAPAEKVGPTITLEQIQQKVVQLAAEGAEKKAKVRGVISTYGTKVSDLKDTPEKWDEVWQKLTALEA